MNRFPEDEEQCQPNDPNADYEYDYFGFIKPPFWINDWREIPDWLL